MKKVLFFSLLFAFLSHVVGASLGGLESESRTVNLHSAMTTTEIQKKINDVHKYIPDGITITFQFEDGQYNLNETLMFSGFYGGGKIIIQGNPNDFIASTNKSVHLTNSGSGSVLVVSGCKTQYCMIQGLQVTLNSAASDITGIIVMYSGFAYIYNNSVSGNSTALGACIQITNGTSGEVKHNYISNSYWGINAYCNGFIFSENNRSIGTIPKNGLAAAKGGVIARYGTQPTGSSKNINPWAGGEIR